MAFGPGPGGALVRLRADGRVGCGPRQPRRRAGGDTTDVGGAEEGRRRDRIGCSVLEQQPQADGLLVTASIYTLLLPEDWQDHCVAEETGQWLSLYSKENQDAGYGGLLCSIGWTDDPESYAGIPGCQLLGRVTIDGVTYDVVADVIDDPQAPASGQLREQYLAMQQELPSVFQSLQFGDGVVYTPAA